MCKHVVESPGLSGGKPAEYVVLKPVWTATETAVHTRSDLAKLRLSKTKIEETTSVPPQTSCNFNIYP